LLSFGFGIGIGIGFGIGMVYISVSVSVAILGNRNVGRFWYRQNLDFGRSLQVRLAIRLDMKVVK